MTISYGFCFVFFLCRDALQKLVKNVDTVLFRELNDYLFQGKSLDIIVKEYNTNVKNSVYTDLEKIENGKMLYEVIRHELRQIRKTDTDLVAIIVDYLFNSENTTMIKILFICHGTPVL